MEKRDAADNHCVLHRAFRTKPVRLLFAAPVLGSVMLACFFSVMRRMKMVAVRDVRVMTALFVISALVMFRCLTMMTRGVLVMLCRFMVMLRTFMCCHD